MYSSFKNELYIKASSFDEYHSIMKQKMVSSLILRYTFANRGHKIIRDNLKEAMGKLYFKKEAVCLGKKSRLMPIRLPIRSNDVVKIILEYILNQEESFKITCINYLRSECNVCVRSQENKNEIHCSQSMLGFQYRYLIIRLNNSSISTLYDEIESMIYQSPLNNLCISG